MTLPPPIQVHLLKLKFVQKAGGEGALGLTWDPGPYCFRRFSEVIQTLYASQALTQHAFIERQLNTACVKHWTIKIYSPPPPSSEGDGWVNGSS